MAKKQKIAEPTYITDIKAVGHVKRIVEEDWYSKWLKIEAPHDDGIDSLVFLYKKYAITKKLKKNEKREFAKKPTGGLLFLQVKGGDGYRDEAAKRPGHIGVKVGADYIESHRPRWNMLPGPVILVYVDTNSERKQKRAWWANLKLDSSYDADNKQIILVPRKQTFGLHTKGDWRRLSCQFITGKYEPPVKISHHSVNFIPLGKSVKSGAREAYLNWTNGNAVGRHHTKLGEITVSRVGWRHMTRRGRRPERILHSLLLLGVAKQVIEEGLDFGQLGRVRMDIKPDGSAEIRDYLGIRVQALFPHRHPASVQVVLKRRRRYDPTKNISDTKIWFLSVYEKFKNPFLE